jgi:hypothetical protein
VEDLSTSCSKLESVTWMMDWLTRDYLRWRFLGWMDGCGKKLGIRVGMGGRRDVASDGAFRVRQTIAIAGV